MNRIYTQNGDQVKILLFFEINQCYNTARFKLNIKKNNERRNY